MESLQNLFALPPEGEWVRFLLFLVTLAGVVGVAQVLQKKLNLSKEVARKSVHILTGVLVFFAPRMFVSALPLLLLAVIFIVVNALAIRSGLLDGIGATKRKSYGTVYYPLSFLILVAVLWSRNPEIVSLSILTLALGDAAAGIVGTAIRRPTVFRLTSDKKSIEGSLAMFIVSSATLYGGMKVLSGTSHFPDFFLLTVAVSCSIIATCWEAISSRGLDNLSVPLSVAFVLWYFLTPSAMRDYSQFTLGISLGIFMAIGSYYARFLAASGAVATFLLASLMFGVGGWKWTIPIVVFFVLSSALSKVGKTRKKSVESYQEKSSTRDYAQVAANGGVAGVLMVLQYLIPSYDFYPLYLGSIAAVTADTWGTEIGILSRQRPFLITSFKTVEAGTNGGITWIGLGGGIVGAAMIVLSAWTWIEIPSHGFAIAAAGVLASLVDSLLGATVQGEYQCMICGAVTEKKFHCQPDTKGSLVKGYSWLNNDAVNLVCGVVGGLLMLL
ncbi:MAG: DUF92 domain-containing protein, partial [Bacteroidota bacterium]